MLPKLNILFLCVGNSCRSQMAEGWARHLKADVIEPYSAGLKCVGVNPLAVRVMAEAGVDISRHQSKTLEAFADQHFDYVITVCDADRQTCPWFPRTARVVHVSFDDPPHLAAKETDPEKALAHYRRVRDEIRDYIEKLPDNLRDFW